MRQVKRLFGALFNFEYTAGHYTMNDRIFVSNLLKLTIIIILLLK